jgi:hypothetical protein
MSEKEGNGNWLSIFSITGALIGWVQHGTLASIAWGAWLGATLPPLFIFICFLGTMLAKKMFDNWPVPEAQETKVRVVVAEPEVKLPTWEEAFAEHLKARGLRVEDLEDEAFKFQLGEVRGENQSPVHDKYGSFVGMKVRYKA